MQYENERTEFKSRLTEDIYKEVIAFANTDGGVIYIGIDDRGNAVGLSDIDENYTRLTNGIRDAIHPDVTMFIRYVLQDNNIIRIEVSEGSSKPYYLTSKGLRPSGVYIRQGTSSVQASPEQIRRLIKESDGDNYEEMRSLLQELSFEEAAAAFSRYHVEFGEEKFPALGITNLTNGQYTNLALLLSDQCQHTTKVAVFSDRENTHFQDAKEFGGSLFKQLEATFNYLSLCSHTEAEIKGLERIESPDYPEEALREALLNALVHRDYGFSGSIIINVNAAAIEFISLGGLLPGLSREDILSGISQPRNRKLAEIFHRLKLIESYGTGIRRIYALYKNCPEQPSIEVTPNTFKLTLPNMNRAKEKFNPPEISPQEQRVLDYLAEHKEISEEDLQSLLGIKKTRAYQVIRRMDESGLIEIIGKGAGKRLRKR